MSKYFYYCDCSMAGVHGPAIEWNVVARTCGGEYEYFITETHSGGDFEYKCDQFFSIKKGPLTDEFVEDEIVGYSNFIPKWEPYSEEDHGWVIYQVQEKVLPNIKKAR